MDIVEINPGYLESDPAISGGAFTAHQPQGPRVRGRRAALACRPSGGKIRPDCGEYHVPLARSRFDAAFGGIPSADASAPESGWNLLLQHHRVQRNDRHGAECFSLRTAHLQFPGGERLADFVRRPELWFSVLRRYQIDGRSFFSIRSIRPRAARADSTTLASAAKLERAAHISGPRYVGLFTWTNRPAAADYPTTTWDWNGSRT